MAAQHNRSYLITTQGHGTRALVALGIWLTMLVLIYIPVRWVVGGELLAWGVSFSLFAFAFGATIHHFVVGVPEVTALITINQLVSPRTLDQYYNQTVFLTGLWFKYPWEKVNEGLFINLRIVPQEFSEDFPARDGPNMPFRGVLVYRPDPTLLPRHIAVDSAIINRALVDRGTGELSMLVSKDDAQTARGKLADYEASLVGVYEEGGARTFEEGSLERDIADSQGVDRITYEWLYGIDLIHVAIGDVGYSPEYQKVLETRARSVEIDALAEKIARDRHLEPKDAMNVALLQFGIVSKEIFELDGNAAEILNALLGLLRNRGRAA